VGGGGKVKPLLTVELYSSRPLLFFIHSSLFIILIVLLSIPTKTSFYLSSD
jgi:hypothetical protein